MNGIRLNNMRCADNTIDFACLYDIQVIVDKAKLKIISRKKITESRPVIKEIDITNENWNNVEEVKDEKLDQRSNEIQSSTLKEDSFGAIFVISSFMM